MSSKAMLWLYLVAYWGITTSSLFNVGVTEFDLMTPVKAICGGKAHPAELTQTVEVAHSLFPGYSSFALLSLASEPQITFAIDITPI